MREAPKHTPAPLLCSEWYSTTPSRDTLERAGTHWNVLEPTGTCCGTLRHSEKISGVHSQQLRLNKNFTLPMASDTSSDILTDWSVIKVPLHIPCTFQKVIHRLSTCTILHTGSSYKDSMFHVVFEQHLHPPYCHSYHLRYNTIHDTDKHKHPPIHSGLRT